MNRDLALLIQSYLDGELAGRKARKVADWIETDATARALYQELAQTRTFLRVEEAELPRPVPDTRAFYWSGVERRIAELERAKAVARPAAPQGWLAGWRRYAAPLVAAALVALLAVPAANYLSGDRGDPYMAHLADVENLSDGMGSYSFRTESGNMFVVWLYDRSDLFEAGNDAQEVLAQ